MVPNIEEYFGDYRNESNLLDVTKAFTYGDVAEVSLLRLGAFGFKFLDGGPLRSIPQYRMRGSGEVPQHVMENGDAIVDLQSQRISFANFIAAALFGRLAASRHSGLSGAQFARMEEIVAFAKSGSLLHVEQSPHTDKLVRQKIRYLKENPTRVRVTKATELDLAIDFALHLASRESDFQSADLQACMSLNYQAAILHSRQHAAASLALNFSVTEALVDEIFHAYGLVGAGPAKSFASRTHSAPQLSRREFKELRVHEKLLRLHTGGLIDIYLQQRADSGRDLRNKMMHRAAQVGSRQSGEMQTVVRDLWAYLIDQPFELLMGFGYRI